MNLNLVLILFAFISSAVKAQNNLLSTQKDNLDDATACESEWRDGLFAKCTGSKTIVSEGPNEGTGYLKEIAVQDHGYEQRMDSKETEMSSMTFDAALITKDVSGRNPLGMNVNFIFDKDSNRPKGSISLEEVLDDYKNGFIRYPGGEKSDAYRFAPPPYSEGVEVADPQLYGWFLEDSIISTFDLLGFDEYMDYVNKLGAEPYLVVAYDPNRNDWYNHQDIVLTKEDAIEHAKAWVQYANIDKGYGVKYWEIGNENYTRVSNRDKTLVAQDVAEIAAAMKTVDPTIKVGTNTKDTEWTQEMYTYAGEHLDFFNISHYVSYSSYEEKYLIKTGDYSLVKSKATQIRDFIISNKPDMELFVSECGVLNMDHEANSIANSIIIMDLLGSLASSNIVNGAFQWGTRYLDYSDRDTKFHMIDSLNNVLAAGTPLRLYNNFMKDKIVLISTASSSVPANLRAYATVDASGNSTLFLLNKGASSITFDLNIANVGSVISSNMYTFKGTTKTDVYPTWSKPSISFDANNSKFDNVALDAYSINVIDIRTTPDTKPFDPTDASVQNSLLLSGVSVLQIEMDEISFEANMIDGILNVNLKESKGGVYSVYDMSGTTVYQSLGGQQHTINMRGMVQGIYVLKITSENRVAVLKFIYN